MTAVLEAGAPAEVVDEQALEMWAVVQRVQQGDREAFGLIYQRYVDTVFRFIYFRVGHRQTAEDLCSETFLRGMRRIDSFTWQGRDFGAWLVTIARNLVVDHFKSGRSRLESLFGLRRDDEAVDATPEGSPESVVADHLVNVELMSALKLLEAHSRDQYDVLVYRFLDGLPVAETAAVMGKNEGAIKALQYRAVRTLGRMLELVDPDDPSAGVIATPPAEPAQSAEPIVIQIPPPRTSWEPTPDYWPEPAAGVDWSPAAQRTWARANGREVKDRGVLPGWLRDAYAEAMRGGEVRCG